MSKASRFIKDKESGEKVGGWVTSVNLTEDHKEFVAENERRGKKVNVSEITRSGLDELIKEVGWRPKGRAK